jgi:hypothetical protein
MVTAVTHFQRRLQQAIQEGAATRRVLIHQVASLPTEKLATLPPDVFRLLGASGLVTVLEQRAAAERRDKSPPPAERPPTKVLKNPLLGLLMVIGVLTVLGPLPEHLAPLLAPDTSVSRSIATTTWPACPRLDHAVDGCLYTVGGGGDTSLLDAANRVDIAAEDFIAINAHIPGPVSSVLPRGSQLVIWRNKLILEGTTE